MTTIPRLGFKRSNGSVAEDPIRCRTGKLRYETEAVALEALVRVRHKRPLRGKQPENRIYLCDDCKGWHLTSNGMHPEDLTPVRERQPREDIWAYTKRLERRIADQRSQLLSLHTLGYGAGNRESRQRISKLVLALGRMTERWEIERRHREELVAILNERCSCRRCRRRLRRAENGQERPA